MTTDALPLVSITIGHPLGCGYGAKVDERDREIAEARIVARLALPADAPRVGDVVLIGGKPRRVAHVWEGDSVQWTEG